MKSYTTRDEIIRFAANVPLTEQASLRKSVAKSVISTATFLSHSSQDQDLVAGTALILRNHGASVYLDEIDPEMPPYTNKETATLLKSRVNESKKFVLIVTENSKNSRWVPWELGIADGYKGLGNISLFPAVESTNNTAWTKSEYLGIYRRIIWGDLEGYEKPLWIVLDEEENTATPLGTWLRT